ncbi:hypothetical protein N2152v2_004781 [Parachlorella kessleri]
MAGADSCVPLAAAGVVSALLLVGKSLSKRWSREALEQEAPPVFVEPRQAAAGSKRLPEPVVTALALQGNSTRSIEMASPKALQPTVVLLPPLKTSVYAPAILDKCSPDGCDDGDSPPDSPTEVLHWHRPSRAWSLPAAASAFPALTLRFEEVLATERAARIAAEAAAEAAVAAAAADANNEQQELAQQLVDAQNMVASLRVVNKELQTEVDKLQSQIPSMEVAYEQLKGSFFKLQRMYGGAKSKLGKAMNEVVRLRAELRAVQAQ